jgi:tetratricopeptide (TPR) repeat protein
MTEKEYLYLIRSKVQAEDTIGNEIIELVDEAISLYPQSSALWCLRGDLLQRAEDDKKYELSDAFNSYTKAIEIDPNCAEAYESIGYYHDVIDDDPEKAKGAFERAIELGAGVDSYVGLARVMAELKNDKKSIQTFLNNSPFAETQKVKAIWAEIASGK